jgi:hypothetical protein
MDVRINEDVYEIEMERSESERASARVSVVYKHRIKFETERNEDEMKVRGSRIANGILTNEKKQRRKKWKKKGV